MIYSLLQGQVHSQLLNDPTWKKDTFICFHIKTKRRVQVISHFSVGVILSLIFCWLVFSRNWNKIWSGSFTSLDPIALLHSRFKLQNYDLDGFIRSRVNWESLPLAVSFVLRKLRSYFRYLFVMLCFKFKMYIYEHCVFIKWHVCRIYSYSHSYYLLYYDWFSRDLLFL